MSRFIAQLLIVSLPTLNIAWAVDACVLTDPGASGGTYVQVDGEPPVDPANAGIDCDDWCHAWANPVALPGAIVPDGYASSHEATAYEEVLMEGAVLRGKMYLYLLF